MAKTMKKTVKKSSAKTTKTKATKTVSRAKKSTSSKKKKPTITQQELISLIEKRAYELYLERGGAHGDDQADWYRAEKELKEKYNISN